jgi:CelD/BcsL family acetyltransferase involved in cellulose biosynthesis
MEATVSARLDARQAGWEPAAQETRSTARTAAADLRLDVYESFDAIAHDWRLFERHADCTVFQSFRWLSTWQRHIGAPSGVQPAVVVGRSAGAIVFMLPLAVQSMGPVRALTWLGAELSDYNAPLLAPDFARHATAGRFITVWHDVVQRLQARFRFDVVDLGKMPETLGAQPNPMLALPVTLNPSGAYATPLAASWDEFYGGKRSSSTRRRDRTKRKRLAEFGEIRLVTPDTPDSIRATVEILAAQKTRAFARMGVGNLFARPGHMDFYLDLAAGEGGRDLVHVSRLEVGPLIAAANLGLTFRDRYYHLLASYDDGEVSRFGPGAAHLHDVMRYAIEHGYRIFDFTIGDEPYKRDWCDGTVRLYDHVAAMSWPGRAVYAPMMARRWLKRQIKQTPLLWNAFSWARATASRLRGGGRLRDEEAA